MNKVKVRTIASQVKDIAIGIAVATVFSMIQDVVVEKIKKVL